MSLSEKLDVLSKQDDELADMVDEGELEDEVEQPDMIREKVGLCIMGIDVALERASSHAATSGSITPRGDSSAIRPIQGKVKLLDY